MAAALAEEAEDAREEAAGRAAAAEAESHQTRTSEAVAVARAAEAEAEAAKAKAEGAAAAAEAANTLSASKANAVKALETAEAARTAAKKKAAADHAETAAWGHEQRNQLVGQREAALSLEEQLAQASHEAATWQSDALFSSDAAEEARSAVQQREEAATELAQYKSRSRAIFSSSRHCDDATLSSRHGTVMAPPSPLLSSRHCDDATLSSGRTSC